MKKKLLLTCAAFFSSIIVGGMSVTAGNMPEFYYDPVAKVYHLFDRVRLSSFSAGNYSHNHLIGKDITNGKDIYASCVVTRLGHTYNLVCIDCSYTMGPNIEYEDIHQY